MANLRRINQEDLRNHNLSVTLDTLLRAQKPMSRADLAKETGLTKATLSLLASMLIESGVVQEGEPVVSTTYGRPSTPLEIRGGSIAGIGLQINTDGYGCLALDLNGDTLGREWVSEDMTGTDPYEIFAKLDAMTFPLESRLKRRGCKVVGAGFALPGIVTDDMWLLVARNLGWENVNLTRFNVVRRLDVVAGNEAKMAAIAQIPGYATERAPFLNVVDRTDSFIYLSTDIGIGGAVVRDGEVVMGSHGFAGEIGHLFVTEAARGKGYGAKMLDFARKKLPEHDHPTMGVINTNTRAIALYKRMGWRLTGTVLHRYDPAGKGTFAAVYCEELEMQYRG